MAYTRFAAVVGLLLLKATVSVSSASQNVLVSQWVSVATASNQYGLANCTSPCWHVRDVLGPPDALQCGDDSHAWRPYSVYESWVTVTFNEAVYASQISIYESRAPGFVQKVQLVDTSEILRDIVFTGFWYGGAPDATACDPNTNSPRALTIPFPTTNYLVMGAKIWTRAGGNEAIDAVQMQGWTSPGKAKPRPNLLNNLFNQWPMSAIASSAYSTTGLMGSWSAMDAAGAPDVDDGQCGDFTQAWSPATGGAGPEWVLLMYETPMHATSVSVHETNIGGFVRRIELLDTNKQYHTVFNNQVDATPCGGWLTVPFLMTKFLVTGVRVTTQVQGSEQIDAVRLSGFAVGKTKAALVNVNSNL